MIGRAPRIQSRIDLRRRRQAPPTIRNIKRIWAELDYAQRRSIELRTGVPMGTSKSRVRIGREFSAFDDFDRLRAA